MALWLRSRPALLIAGLLALVSCGEDSPTGDGGSARSAKVVGSLDLPDDSNGIYCDGSYAYVASTAAGLQVIDVTDPTSPSIVAALGTIQASGGIEPVSIGATRALYVCANLAGVHLVNITNPLAPTLMSTVNTPGTAQDVALTTIASPVLGVADGATGLQVYFGASGSASVDTPEFAIGIAATTVHCFVTDLSGTIGTPVGALHVVDVSTPAAPALVQTLPLPGSPSGIAIDGDHAYVAAGDPGMYVIDISDPTAPSVDGQTSALPATGPIAADPTRSLVYLGTTDTAGFPRDGLKIVEVSNPSSPRVVATVDLPDYASGVAMVGDHVYVVTDDVGPGGGPSTLQIVELSGF